MERAGLDVVANPRPAEPPSEFAGRLPGEREHERVAGERGPGLDPVRDAAGEHPGLARSGPGDHRHEARLDGDGPPLIGVEVVEQGVGAHPCMVRLRGDAPHAVESEHTFYCHSPPVSCRA